MPNNVDTTRLHSSLLPVQKCKMEKLHRLAKADNHRGCADLKPKIASL